MTEAWLHRRGKRTWHFTPNPKLSGLCHTTRNGTTYAISCDWPYGTFQILRLDNCEWCVATHELRARSIEFADGGVYTFPGKR